MTEKPRTLKQNKAIHLYFTHLSEELNNAGLDVQWTLEHNVEIPWNPYLVKELIWKRVLLAQLGKDSTTKMTTKEIDLVFETITKYLSTNFGLSIDFPSFESLSMKDLCQK